MLKKWWLGLVALGLLSVLMVACSDDKDSTDKDSTSDDGSGEEIVLDYWQYAFDAKVKLMDELIEEFEADNPGIKVKQTNFPYDQ
jgi:multiple sugar transport system substrate-binding protein